MELFATETHCEAKPVIRPGTLASRVLRAADRVGKWMPVDLLVVDCSDQIWIVYSTRGASSLVLVYSRGYFVFTRPGKFR